MAAGIANWLGSVQHRLDGWARQHRDRMAAAAPWTWKWPWQDFKRQKQELQDEYKRRREQIQSLCCALKAQDLTDLQDVLSAMILSECVYKKPEADLIRAVNKFKTDFGEQLVPLERIQPSLEHAQHRYVLAESGGALFASFIGTKKYKDVVADANILQGAIFHDDNSYGLLGDEGPSAMVSSQLTGSLNSEGQPGVETESIKDRKRKQGPKPAAHRGFLARAKGIPAIELYKLAQKKERRLVLCGHSLGGAVAVLATLAILRAFASSASKSDSRIQVKCITFSQPPVGNAALRDYVHQKGWQRYFRTYCIPEDVVPRLLSPAYFQHYREQAYNFGSQQSATNSSWGSNSNIELVGKTVGNSSKLKSSERIVLGLGPLQNSLWRISKLVPLMGVSTAFRRSGKIKAEKEESTSETAIHLVKNKEMPQSLEVQEGSEAVTLVPLSPNTSIALAASEKSKASESTGIHHGSAVGWRSRVPSFPFYVPFGQLFLLEKTSVEPLSASEYTRLTSVQSVLMELRERFQSHTMRSYRARFQKIYDMCMCDGNPPLFTTEHLPNLPHLQQWLGLRGAVVTEIGRIVEPLVICTATSLVPLGWCGIPRDKQHEPLLIDVQGYGLHLCTLVKAQVNGQWCSTTIESLPQPPSTEKEISNLFPKLQKMRIRVGPPLQRPSQEQLKRGLVASTSAAAESISGPDLLRNSFTSEQSAVLVNGNYQAEGLCQVMIHCSSDFVTASKEVIVRLRRVRLLGLEGAGKTSLFYALLGQGMGTTLSNGDGVLSNNEWQEGIAEGVAYIDPAGVNLQDLVAEVNQLKQELAVDSRQLGKRLDLVILVHNLAHKVPRLRQTPNHVEAKPALSLLIDEVLAAGVPLVLSLTNKFAVSAERREIMARRVREMYKIPSSMSITVNSCPYMLHQVVGSSSAAAESLGLESEIKGTNLNSKAQSTTQKLMFAPLSLVQLPFRKKDIVLPIEGVTNLHALVHNVLLSHETDAFEELAKEQLVLETKKELTKATSKSQGHDLVLPSSAAAAAGAGFGLLIALIAAAASSLRKP